MLDIFALSYFKLFHDHFNASKYVCHLFQLFMLFSAEQPETFKYIQSKHKNSVYHDFIVCKVTKPVIFVNVRTKESDTKQ